MAKDLTDSLIDRQNILNNQYALEEIKKAIGLDGVLFEGEYKFIKENIAVFFAVDPRTINRYLENYYEELDNNGHEVLRGKRLREFKLALKSAHVEDINVLD